jgi:hypothetical protein
MGLTKEQMMERNLTLAETQVLGILECPQLLDSIPDGAHVIFFRQAIEICWRQTWTRPTA